MYIKYIILVNGKTNLARGIIGSSLRKRNVGSKGYKDLLRISQLPSSTAEILTHSSA